ncbi:MAG: carbon storage regulator [Candidatus Marinimicrobia bacterium]|nr:carbon storage regulator [Candidatus Neomarinimicrobiota bacterium]|tara:strand:+ start:13032 stop:13238 length:207 start_codon:yes stop_codon:yes gene_type:complete
MLVLTRKSGEKIRIGKDIVVSIVSKVHGPLKLGIEAPREITVYREEIYQSIKNTNRHSIAKESIYLKL